MIPLESDRANYEEGENIRLDLLADLPQKARAERSLVPADPESRGRQRLAQGPDHHPYGGLLRGDGRSIFGPVCFNSRRAR